MGVIYSTDAAPFPSMLISMLDRDAEGHVSFNYARECGWLEYLVMRGRITSRERADLTEVKRQWHAYVDTLCRSLRAGRHREGPAVTCVNLH